MTKQDLLLESLYILENSSSISDKMANQYKSKGFQRAKQSLLTNTKILKAKLKEKNVDVTKIQKDAISLAIGLKPNVKKLIKGEGDKVQLLKVIFNRINSEARASIDPISATEGAGMYAMLLFLEIFLMVMIKGIVGGAILPLLIVSCLLTPIMEESLKRNTDISDEGKFVYNKLLSSFSFSKFLFLVLAAGWFSIPLSIFLVSLSVFYEMYTRLLADKEFEDNIKDTNLIKYICVIFLIATIGVMVTKVSPDQLARITKFFSSKL